MKEKIVDLIRSFKSDEEIFKFINERIELLEKNSVKKTVGVNYTDTFDDYIGNNISYKTGEFFLTDKYPSLKYDDLIFYFNIIKKLSIDKTYYNEMDLFSPVFFEIYNYLKDNEVSLTLDDIDSIRTNIYRKAISKNKSSVSIREFAEKKAGLCAERSGLTHNFFKLLGVDSLVVFGEINGIGHAYNLIFPRGYENGPAVLFDASFDLSFKIADKKHSFGFFSVLSDDDYTKLHDGEVITIDIDKSINQIAYRYDLSIQEFKESKMNYSLGLNNKKLERKKPYKLEK